MPVPRAPRPPKRNDPDDPRRLRIGRNIKRVREKRGLSQDDLARRLPEGTTNTSVSRWENGRHVPRLPLLSAIAEALEIPVDELMAPSAEELQEQQATAARVLEEAAEQLGQPRRSREEDDDEPGEAGQAS